MARQEKKYHYIYKITCNVTKRYYIGMHSTDNLEDGYFGSGKRLWFSINYHGKENHVKEIIEYLPTRQLLKEREKDIVNKELLGDVLCMNLKEGGEGGGRFWSEEHMKKCSKAGNLAFKKKLQNDEEFRKKLSEKYSQIIKKTRANGKLKPPDWTGKKHSDETKEKMSNSSNGVGLGCENSQYGTCWVTKEGLNKKIKKEELDSFTNEGWVKGRFAKIDYTDKMFKLTIEDVLKIKNLINLKVKNVDIGKEFNVKPETISKIKRNIIYRNI